MQDLALDPALEKGGRGARKVLVTDLYEETEEKARQVRWWPPVDGDKCPVQLTEDLEIGFFTEDAPQDRHCHERGTEIYWLLRGQVEIEVAGEDYCLAAGDALIVNPGAAHEVKPTARPFLCGVIQANCGGAADKFVC
jgi:mannose-6-phosphate isomerase-like protein (cupin superfamily)